MSRPKLLDAFCGAGGAGYGYHLAGFDVTGIDLAPQPRYPFRFIQGDALEYLAAHGHEYAAIHCSPPCQAHTAMRTMPDAKPHADLIPATRELLKEIGKPYVIENVVGAPLIDPILLCGTMFNLGVDDAELRRHRLFETTVPMLTPPCRHGWRSACLGVYGGHVRNRKRRQFGVYGYGVRDSRRKHDRGVADFTVEQGREAMGISWMTVAELSQAIPPAYTKFIGERLIGYLNAIAEDESDHYLATWTCGYHTEFGVG